MSLARLECEFPRARMTKGRTGEAESIGYPCSPFFFSENVAFVMH